MDPTTVFCPNVVCPARGQVGPRHIRLHARQDRRFLGTACHKTFTTTTGTACSRLRSSAATVTLVVTLIAHGCPLPAIVVACRIDERTVAPWWGRAGVQGQAVQQPLVEPPRDHGEVPADEIRVTKPGGMVWMALARMVSTRLCCTDGLCADIRALRETCRDPVQTGVQGRPRWRPWHHLCIAQVVKRDVQRRVVAVERRIIDGIPARVERLRRRSHGDGVITTAYIERLNATFRERLPLLARRGRALARHTLTRQHGMYLVGTVYNFCTYHASLRLAAPAAGIPLLPRTPAMAAEITDHGWTVRELLSFQVPPPRWSPPKQRGRPSRALKRLLERWCGGHS